MEKEFVSYNQALRLKKLGFDEKVFSYFEKGAVKIYTKSIDGWDCNAPFVTRVSRPTFSQVFRWFRDKGYRFNVVNNSSQVDGNYFYDVWFIGKFLFESNYIYKTYEEAELACLETLIKHVESKSE